jgi:hypothetical protein
MRTGSIILLFTFFYPFDNKIIAQPVDNNFKNYRHNLEIIKGKYEDPWFSETTPGPYRSIEGLKFLQFIERKRLNEDPAITDIWIITCTGKIFRGGDIDLAIQEIKYFPQNEKEAVRLAVVIMEHKHRYCDIITGDEDNKAYIPAELMAKSKLPEVKKKEDSYEICLYASHYFTPRFFGKKPQIYELHRYKITILKYKYVLEDIETVDKLTIGTDN